MVLPGVDFDHEAVVRPVGVDFPAVDDGVEEGLGEGGGADQVDEPLLEAAAGEGDVVGPRESCDHACTAAPMDRPQIRPPHQPFPLGDRERLLHGALDQDVGEVDDGLGRGGDGDALVHHHVHDSLVHPDPAPVSSPLRNGDLDRAGVRASQSPQHRRRPVAQRRAFAAGEHGGSEPGEAGEGLGSYGVDTSVQPAEPALCRATR